MNYNKKIISKSHLLSACIGIAFFLAACPNEIEIKNIPAADDYKIDGLGLHFFNGSYKYVHIKPKEGKSLGAVTVYYNGSTRPPSDVGSYPVTFDIAANHGWSSIKGLYAGILTIIEANITAEIIELTDNSWAEGNLASSDAEQWFKFTTGSNGKTIYFEPGTISRVFVQLYDYSTGTEIGSRINLSSYSSFSCYIYWPDYYYIRITSQDNENGTYRIGISSGNTTTWPLDLPTTNVTELTVDKFAFGNISSVGGEQWFKFTSTSYDQYIHFEAGTLKSVYVVLYDNTGSVAGYETNLYNDSNIRLYTSQRLTIGNEYYIRITPRNYAYGTYKIGFNSTVTPPPETEFSNATTLTANTWADGNIAVAGGEQGFKFTATAATQFIHFEPGTLSDVYIQVFDNTGATVVSGIGLSSNTLYISRTLTNGNEYFIRVTPSSSSNSGSYRIAFNIWLLPPDPNVTTLTADTWAEGNIAASSGEQWFKFTATAAAQYIHFEPGTLSDVYVQVYDNTGTTVGNQTRLYGSTLYTTRTLTIGNDYYIRVTPYPSGTSASGSYRIGFNTSTSRPSVIELPASNVNTLLTSTWAEGYIAISGGEQWFKFTAAATDQYIHFEPGALNSIYVQVYDDTGMAVGSQATLSNNTLYTSLSLTSGNGYYINVRQNSGIGAYKINLSVSALINLPSANVTQLTADTWAEGDIASSGGLQWFKFTATAATQYIHFLSGTLTNIYVQVYDNTGTLIGSQTQLTSSNLYTSRTLTNGNEYYIKITPYSSSYSGAYRIGFNTSTTRPSIINLPALNVTQLTTNTWANGNIAVTGGEQWFKFTATAASQNIHFEPGPLSSLIVQLYDNTGIVVGGQTTLSSSTLYTSRTLSNANEYYIRVTPYSSSYSGAYRIGYNSLPVPPNTIVTTMTAGTWAAGNISALIGVQWFKFTATAAAQYIHFEPGALSSVNVQLYDNTGATIGSQTALSSSISLAVTIGNEYYIRLTPSTGYSGSYKILFNTSIMPPVSGMSRLFDNFWANGNINTLAGVQWFRFTATAAAQYIHFQPGTLSDIYVQAYDNTGTAIGSQINLFGATLYTSLAVTSGNEYYIKVTPFSNGSGSYKIGFNTSTAQPASITTLNAGIWADGNITVSGGEQWFMFSATAASHDIYFEPGTLSDIYIQLHDNTGTAIESQINLFGATLNTSLQVTSGNEYYIKVTPFGSSTGVFRIKLD